jgi:BirA family biotin operon repressor/biotin-[acetyl-CoA-carboxylase] ligase
MAAQIAAAKAISRLSGKKALLRWPNDIYVEGKKIAGVLTEFKSEGDRLDWMSIGIGINVNNKIKSLESMAELAGHPLSRREVLLAALDEWDKIKGAGSYDIGKCWNSLAEGRGRKVMAIERKGKENRPIEKGVFLGVDVLGRGVLKNSKDEKRAFYPGVVSFLMD